MTHSFTPEYVPKRNTNTCPSKTCTQIFISNSLFSFFCFLGPYPQHMEVPKLGVELELQLPAYTTARATPDLSCICDIQHSSRQHQILNPLSRARDQTHVFIDTSWVPHHWATMGMPTVESRNNPIVHWLVNKLAKCGYSEYYKIFAVFTTNFYNHFPLIIQHVLSYDIFYFCQWL